MVESREDECERLTLFICLLKTKKIRQFKNITLLNKFLCGCGLSSGNRTHTWNSQH